MTELTSYDMPVVGTISIPTDESRWPKTGESGFVPVWAVVGDPDQPRQYFDPDELNSLAENIKQHGQVDVATVFLLTEDEREKYRLPDDRRPLYMLVGGERRQRAITIAGVPLLEIRVKSYQDRKHRFRQAYLHNELHAPLSAIENARALKRMLVEDCNGNVAELMRQTNHARPYINSYLKLLNLPDQVLHYMHPSRKDDQLKFGTAQLFADLLLDKVTDEVTIESFAKRIMESREGGTTAADQRRWVEMELMRSTGTPLRTGLARGNGPSDERIAIYRLVDGLRARLLGNMTVSEDVQAKALAELDADEIDQLIHSLVASGETLDNFIERMKRIRAGKKTTAERLVANAALANEGMTIVDYYEGGQFLRVGQAVSDYRLRQLREAGWLRLQKERKADPDARTSVVVREDVPTPKATNPFVAVEAARDEKVEQETAKPLRPAPERRAVARPTFPPDRVNGGRDLRDGYESMIKVSFYERPRPGGQEQLVRDRYISFDTYQSLKRDGKLHRQRHALPPSTAESEYCVKMGIST